MKRKLLLGSLFAATIILSGCGGNNQETNTNTSSERSGKSVWANNEIYASIPENQINEKIGLMPSTAEIYIDASGSMKPYFRAEGDLITGNAMINTLSEIVNLHESETSIYFLGNKNKYKGYVNDIIKSVNNQPNDANTLFHEFFANAACKLDTANTIIYLVTDGIMSIQGQDMANVLVELRGKIQTSLRGHSNLAGAIFRYVGGYKGRYWNSVNKPVSLKTQIDRPYYIIALGNKETMRWLQSVPKEKLNNPEQLFMGVHDLEGHHKVVLQHGDNAKIGSNSKPVKLIFDLPACLQNENFENASLTNGGNKLNIKVDKEPKRLVAKIPETQPLMTESGKIRITLSVPNKIPNKWVDEWNCVYDIEGPDSETTFGLATLVTGMFNAFEGENSELLNVNFIYRR